MAFANNLPVSSPQISAAVLHERFSALSACLGKPALLSDETADGFQALFDQLLESVVPFNAIEFIYVRDAALLTVEIFRFRRHQVAIIKSAQARELKKLLGHMKLTLSLDTIIYRWLHDDRDTINQLVEFLNERDLSLDDVYAKAYQASLDEIQRIEIMIAGAESRRFAFLREIDRGRDNFKKRLHDAVKQADGSFALAPAEESE